MYLVAGSDRVLVRPLDYVPGYVVVDGEPAQLLDQPLAGPALPGPDPDHFWTVEQDGNERRITLISFDGIPTGLSVPTPDGFAEPDGTGWLLVRDRAGQTHFVGPDGAHTITDGYVLATGPTRWLVAEGNCPAVVIDRATGERQSIALTDCDMRDFLPSGGLVSPDGTRAALARVRTGRPVVELIDLDTGKIWDTGIPLGSGGGVSQAMAWTPDSARLLVTAERGAIKVLEPQRRTAYPLAVPDEGFTHLILRITT